MSGAGHFRGTSSRCELVLPAVGLEWLQVDDELGHRMLVEMELSLQSESVLCPILGNIPLVRSCTRKEKSIRVIA